MNKIPNILKDLRKNQNLTQFQLSQALKIERHLTQNEIAKEINTSQTNIGRWEKELNEPTASFLIRLADFFDCSVDYLLGREDDLGNITLHTEKPASLPQDEQELLNIYQALSPAHRSQILEYARYFAEKSGAATRRKA